MTLEPNIPDSNTKPPLLSSIQAESQNIEIIFNTYTQNTENNNNDTSNNNSNSSKKSSNNSSLISQQFRAQFGSVAETDNLIEATSSNHISTYSNLLSKIKHSLPQQQPSHIYTKVSSLNILKIYQQQVQHNRTILKPKQRISQYRESEPYSSQQTIPNTTDRNETNSISFTHFNAYSEVNDESVFDDTHDEHVNQVKSQRYRMKYKDEKCVENANGYELMQGDKQSLRQMKIKKVDFTVKKRKVKVNRKSRNYIQFPITDNDNILQTQTVINNESDSFYKDDKSVEKYVYNYCNTCNSFTTITNSNTNNSCVVF